MTRTRIRPTRRATLTLGSAVAALLLFLSPSAAWAHSDLIGTTPGDGESIEVMPEAFVMEFSGDLLDVPRNAVVVSDLDDPEAALADAAHQFAEGSALIEGGILTQPLRQDAPAGTYHVFWSVVYADGHDASGTQSFTVTTGVSPAPEPTPSASPEQPTPEATPSSADSPSPTPQETSDPASSDQGGSLLTWGIAIAGFAVISVSAIVVAVRTSRRR